MRDKGSLFCGVVVLQTRTLPRPTWIPLLFFFFLSFFFFFFLFLLFSQVEPSSADLGKPIVVQGGSSLIIRDYRENPAIKSLSKGNVGIVGEAGGEVSPDDVDGGQRWPSSRQTTASTRSRLCGHRSIEGPQSLLANATAERRGDRL